MVQSTEVEQRRYSINRGDVFLTRTSNTFHKLGISSVALKNYPLATFNGFTKCLRPKKCCELVPEYVGYYLRSSTFRDSILAFSTMSPRPCLNNEMINHLRIFFPSVSEQKKIVRVLKAFDDRIEFNRQKNGTLELIEQTLFKSWFVDFDPVIDNALAIGNPIPEPFQARAKTRKSLGEKHKPLPEVIRKQFPSSFVLTEKMGWIPAGWQIDVLRELYDKIQNDSNPKIMETVHWEGADINWFKTRELADSGAKGATQQNISKSVVECVPSFKLNEKLFEVFSNHVNQIWTSIHSKSEKIVRLIDIRDILIPKLLSGELCISDAEKLSMKLHE